MPGKLSPGNSPVAPGVPAAPSVPAVLGVPVGGKTNGISVSSPSLCCCEHGLGWARARLSIGTTRQWPCWVCNSSSFLGLQTGKRNPACTYPWITKINNIGTDIYSSDWKKAHLNQLFVINLIIFLDYPVKHTMMQNTLQPSHSSQGVLWKMTWCR